MLLLVINDLSTGSQSGGVTSGDHAHWLGIDEWTVGVKYGQSWLGARPCHSTLNNCVELRCLGRVVIKPSFFHVMITLAFFDEYTPAILLLGGGALPGRDSAAGGKQTGPGRHVVPPPSTQVGLCSWEKDLVNIFMLIKAPVMDFFVVPIIRKDDGSRHS